MKRLRGVIIAAAILAFLIAGAIGLFFYLDAVNTPTGKIPEGGVVFSVPEGSSGTRIASELEEKGIIRSSLFFEIILRVRGTRSSLKSGTYLIGASLTSLDVHDLLVSGKQMLRRVAVPEGLTVSQIAKKLHADGIIESEDEFISLTRDRTLLDELGIPAESMEGYLFPETYYMPFDATPKDIIVEMVSTLKRTVQTDFPEIASLPPEVFHQRIILASIVEREYRLADEAKIMAGVFFNRIQKGIALQSCATVVYVITERLGKKHPSKLYNEDIQIIDPYNTYINPGLPPGPICSPGITALSAVFEPAVTEFLYFRLIDPATGRHHFSKTLQEHVDAADLYIKTGSP